ncbi:MAG: hypothetical protein GY870_12615 [archaeon]|nr:hypothetical protein [archaeon]
MISKNERLSRYIETIRIKAAEATQKYEELKLMFTELFDDTLWLYQWIYTNAFFKMKDTPKITEIQKRWELSI